MRAKIFRTVLAISMVVSLAGCASMYQKSGTSDSQKIEKLSKQLDELSLTKKTLEDQLAQEIKDKEVKLQMMEKGLVITFLTDILFDPGKAKIKTSVYPSLDKVSKTLNDNPQFNIGIEGHTDNQPIKYSGWKSNWELSTARALSVLHYLVDDKGLAPERVSAIGYGEYHPVESNDTKEGQRANRRVEIVILPNTKKVKEQAQQQQQEPQQQTAQPQENLK